MSFKNASNLHKLAALPVAPVVEPFSPVVVPAGYLAEHTIGCQIAITRWQGRVSGATANTMNNKAHRLDVTRMFGFIDPATVPTDFMRQQIEAQQETDYAWLKTRLGNKHTDRYLRHDERHSLTMYRTQHGLTNQDLKAWLHMYKQVEQSIEWARTQVVLDQQAGDTNAQYGLVLLCSISAWKLVRPENTNYDPFYEAVVRGISDLEVVKLAPAPGIELPDGFTDLLKQEGHASDFVEA